MEYDKKKGKSKYSTVRNYMGPTYYPEMFVG